MDKKECFTSKTLHLQNDLIAATDIRNSIIDIIKKEHPDFNQTSLISTKELNRYRQLYLEILVHKEINEVTYLENEVVQKLNANKFISNNVEPDFNIELTFGQRIADKIASFGGSWKFIISFLTFMLFWIGINVFILTQKPFDPYPFILLNLILSCIAALQAPVIMMSQNRKEEKDRIRNEHNYQVNLAAELQIRLLHEKIDHQLLKQHHQMLEVQQLQIELMEEIANKIDALENEK